MTHNRRSWAAMAAHFRPAPVRPSAPSTNGRPTAPLAGPPGRRPVGKMFSPPPPTVPATPPTEVEASAEPAGVA